MSAAPTKTKFMGMHMVDRPIHMLSDFTHYSGTVGNDGKVLLVRRDLLGALLHCNGQLLQIYSDYARKRKQTR